MKALKPWKQPNKADIILEQHIMMRRLLSLENKIFVNLNQQMKDFKVHQEIIENRKKWFLQQYNFSHRQNKSKIYQAATDKISKSKSSKLMHQ
ncbi:unnamed protein product (macronuclear) [Paramecium tetraurelia]|uniref:Uncharacterized protein n=1 Tax=Paramecium tetraurelia TaxID=5888 RepID=A0CPE6_PARTE|nr:uncharacterized protein GSPATT00009054001 [Paramecium tetraurelia]CAK72663.1 unnamed protein product [Paramecium tetraurelia]|eukprot:XP_001440060.1 hypothetical protein (macronuclear) [Paramecium tetraurelia strain d4-2]